MTNNRFRFYCDQWISTQGGAYGFSAFHKKEDAAYCAQQCLVFRHRYKKMNVKDTLVIMEVDWKEPIRFGEIHAHEHKLAALYVRKIFIKSLTECFVKTFDGIPICNFSVTPF